MRIFLRAAYVVLALLVPANSFQNSHHEKSIPSVTNYQEKRREKDSSRIRPMDSFGRMSNGYTSMNLSKNDVDTKKNNDYNDDAFGFVLLVGYIVTQDVIFAGTFVLLSALAAIATRNGQLPATNSVPAAVAGVTYIVNLIIPNERLYELLPFTERPETSLPADLSWIELGICSVSMLYGFVLSGSKQEESTSS